MFEGFTRPARAVVASAQAHAVTTTSSEIRPGHLLLALVRVDDWAVGDTFAEFGVTHHGLRQAVADAVRKAS